MRNKKGFTLIELLVVISIIALLMAILMPTLQRVKRQAKAVACQSNQKQWGLAFLAYTSDNDGNIWAYGPDFPNQFGPFLLPETRDYINILLCPTARVANMHKEFLILELQCGHTFSPWVVYNFLPDHLRQLIGSYGLNTCIFDHADLDYGTVTIGRSEAWGTCLVKGASHVPFLLDSRLPSQAPILNRPPPEYEDMVPVMGLDAYSINRHNGVINTLFMDWSVRKVGLKELWALKWHRRFDTANEWTKAGGVQPEDWPEWMRGFKAY